MTGHRGMTLIEMLAVIGMIAVLAAILFPVFAKARESARTHSCLSNQVNIGVALRLYATDNGGRYPPVEDDLTPIIDRYCRDEHVFRCPSSSQTVPMGSPANAASPPAEATSVTSSPAAPPGTSIQGPPPAPGMMPGGPVSAPGGLPTGPKPVQTNYYYRAGMTPEEWPAEPMVSDHDAVHNERANIVFTDGHACRMDGNEWLAAGFLPIDEVWTAAASPPGMGAP